MRIILPIAHSTTVNVNRAKSVTPAGLSVFLSVITSFKDIETIKKCSELGCNSFLVKPVNKHNFFKALKGHKLVSNEYSFH